MLLIDDEALTSWAGTLDTGLGALGFDIDVLVDPTNAEEKVEDFDPDVVLLDLHFPSDDVYDSSDDKPIRTTGSVLLEKLRGKYKRLPIVIFSSLFTDTDLLLEKFAKAPHAVYSKHQITGEDKDGNPEWPWLLSDTLNGAIALAAAEQSSPLSSLGPLIIGGSESMRRTASAISQAANHQDPVLIQGETGTGKVTAARAIHDLGSRSEQGDFICLRCGNRDEDTLATELFGFSEDAFPGASSAQPGVIEKAHGGTLCIDEFQMLPDSVQRRLLRVLETGETTRLGDQSSRPANIRLILTSRHYISDLVEDGVIQGEFAYRIVTFMVLMPPLRERLEDLPDLFAEFLNRANKRREKNIAATLRPEVLKKLRRHAWKGNLLELQNTIDRAVLTTPNNILLEEDVHLLALSSKSVDSSPEATTGDSGSDGKTTERINSQIDPGQWVDRLFRLPVAERWSQFRGKDSMPTNLQGDVLIGMARRLWSNGEKGRIGAKVFDFLKDDSAFDTGDDITKAENQVRTLLKERRVSLTKIDYKI